MSSGEINLTNFIFLRSIDKKYLLNVSIILIGIIMNFIPFYLLGDNGIKQASIQDDNEIEVDISNTRFRDINLLFIGLCTPTLLDLLIECIFMFRTRSPDFIMKNNDTTSISAVRFNFIERLIFAMGVFLRAAFVLLPNSSNDWIVLSLYKSCTNSVLILNFCPIVLFLQRKSSIFGYHTSTFVIFMITLGCVIQTNIILSFPRNSFNQIEIRDIVDILSKVLIHIGIGIFLIMTIRWSTKYYHEFRLNHTKEIGYITNFVQLYVPTTYILTNIIFCVTSLIWFNYSDSISLQVEFRLILAQYLACAIVFVIDIRVRHTEVLQGLVSRINIIFDSMTILCMTNNMVLCFPSLYIFLLHSHYLIPKRLL